MSKRRVALAGLGCAVAAIFMLSSREEESRAPIPASGGPGRSGHASEIASATPASAPVAHPSSARGRPDLYRDAEVLWQSDSAAGPAGEFTRQRIVRTGFKYPLLRVREVRRPGPGGEEIRSRVTSVGDHVIARLREGVAVEQIAAFLDENHASLRAVKPLSGIVVIAHDWRAIEAQDQILARARESGFFRIVEPDYIVEPRGVARIPASP